MISRRKDEVVKAIQLLSKPPYVSLMGIIAD